MFWVKNKKNRYTNPLPLFYCIKLGYKGVYISQTCFRYVFSCGVSEVEGNSSVSDILLDLYIHVQFFNIRIISEFLNSCMGILYSLLRSCDSFQDHDEPMETENTKPLDLDVTKVTRQGQQEGK